MQGHRIKTFLRWQECSVSLPPRAIATISIWLPNTWHVASATVELNLILFFNNHAQDHIIFQKEWVTFSFLLITHPTSLPLSLCMGLLYYSGWQLRWYHTYLSSLLWVDIHSVSFWLFVTAKWLSGTMWQILQGVSQRWNCCVKGPSSSELFTLGLQLQPELQPETAQQEGHWEAQWTRLSLKALETEQIRHQGSLCHSLTVVSRKKKYLHFLISELWIPCEVGQDTVKCTS